MSGKIYPVKLHDMAFEKLSPSALKFKRPASETACYNSVLIIQKKTPRKKWIKIEHKLTFEKNCAWK